MLRSNNNNHYYYYYYYNIYIYIYIYIPLCLLHFNCIHTILYITNKRLTSKLPLNISFNGRLAVIPILEVFLPGRSEFLCIIKCISIDVNDIIVNPLNNIITQYVLSVAQLFITCRMTLKF